MENQTLFLYGFGIIIIIVIFLVFGFFISSESEITNDGVWSDWVLAEPVNCRSADTIRKFRRKCNLSTTASGIVKTCLGDSTKEELYIVKNCAIMGRYVILERIEKSKNGDYQINLSNIKILDRYGNSLIGSDAIATMDSTYKNYKAKNAIDADDKSEAITNSSNLNTWIKIDLMEDKPINYIKILNNNESQKIRDRIIGTRIRIEDNSKKTVYIGDVNKNSSFVTVDSNMVSYLLKQQLKNTT
jgi:hypothetical protein